MCVSSKMLWYVQINKMSTSQLIKANMKDSQLCSAFFEWFDEPPESHLQFENPSQVTYIVDNRVLVSKQKIIIKIWYLDSQLSRQTQGQKKVNDENSRIQTFLQSNAKTLQLVLITEESQCMVHSIPSTVRLSGNNILVRRQCTNLFVSRVDFQYACYTYACSSRSR